MARTAGRPDSTVTRRFDKLLSSHVRSPVRAPAAAGHVAAKTPDGSVGNRVTTTAGTSTAIQPKTAISILTVGNRRIIKRVARAGIEPATFRFSGERCYQLSYLAGEVRATPTGLEPATSAVTGRRANQLRYGAWKALTCRHRPAVPAKL
jgi:hypothetical protein